MWRLLALGVGVLLTGLGASLTVAMKILPNPADALAHTIGTVCHKNFGFGKNILDLICISISLSIGFLFTGGAFGNWSWNPGRSLYDWTGHCMRSSLVGEALQ